MARGGFRVGAGRKPGEPRWKKALPKSVVVGMDGRQFDVPPPLPPGPEGNESPLLVPQDDLNERRQALWKTYAPHALAEGTLTKSRLGGFRQLVAQLDMAELADQDVQRLGATTTDGRAALALYLKIAQRLDASLARFKLTSSGKREAPEKPKATANPWASIAPSAGSR